VLKERENSFVAARKAWAKRSAIKPIGKRDRAEEEKYVTRKRGRVAAPKQFTRAKR